ncbi:DUF455 family protein [Pseudoalteromonas sp. MMG006]|uniref:DUF455 family protein n=1 Tax=Pseudoalteromonas sp. MMG006 TaxID=2822683 RepID=UPI001B391B1F|nr:DUF455 family protein [Pseudoalteromonas sp. MMG006]MBQ4800949.1 DUF455 family protein [Pseudoalteromonas sp. MMG006]
MIGREQSTNFLRGLSYVLCRLQELKAYWLIHSQDLYEKANIAQSMGYEKDLPEKISSRLTQLFNFSDESVQPVAFESQLSELLRNKSISDVAKIIHCSLIKLVKGQQQRIEKLADEPTFLLLIEASELLELGREKIGSSDALIEIDLAILNEDERDEKAALGQISELPGRPDSFVYSPEKDCDPEAASACETELAKFIHFVAIHIEVCAMEVCSYNILTYADMPQKFRTDMAQQIWDEGRHFLIFAEYLKSHLDTEIGDYPYQLDVWLKHQKGTGLLEQLAIEQVLQEGDAVGHNLRLIAGLKKVERYPELRELLSFINADETIHTRIGNKWLTYMCEQHHDNYLEILHTAAEKIGKTIPGNVKLRPAMLEFLGFPEVYREHLMALNIPRKPKPVVNKELSTES